MQDPRFDSAEVKAVPGRPTFESVYNYVISHGVSPNHALGIVQNIESESRFDPTTVNSIGATGLFQHLGSRKEGLIKYTGGDLTNWKRQIDYAMMEPEMKKYLKTPVKDAYEAVRNFTHVFEKPENTAANADFRARELEKKNLSPDFKTRYLQGVELSLGLLTAQTTKLPITEDKFALAEWKPVEPAIPVGTPKALTGGSFSSSEVRDYARAHGLEEALQAGNDLTWALNTVWGTNPDEVARVQKIATGAGVDPETVRTNPKEWENWKKAHDTFQLLTETDQNGKFKYPTAVKWLRDPKNAALGHDDTQWLTTVDQGIKQAAQEGESNFQYLGRAFMSGLSSFDESLTKAPGQIARAYYENSGKAMNALGRLFGYKQIAYEVAPSWMSSNPVSDYYRQSAKVESPYTPPGEDLTARVGRLAAGDVSALYGLSKQISAGVIGSLPQLGAIALGGLPLIGATVFSDTYDQSRSEGKDPYASLVNASLQSGIEIGTEKMGTEKLLKSITAGTAETGVRAVAKDSAQQFIEEFSASIGDSWADYSTGSQGVTVGDSFKQAVGEGLIGAGTGFGISGAHALTAAATEVNSSFQARAVGEKLARLTEHAQRNQTEKLAFDRLRKDAPGSKTAGREQQAAAGFMHEALQEHGMDPVMYVDAGPLVVAFQKRLGPDYMAKVWEHLGLDAESVNAAAAADEQVPLFKASAAQVEDLFGVQGVWDDLSAHTRYFTDGMTHEETDVEMKNLAELTGRLRAKMEEIGAQYTLPESMKKVRETLIKSGGMPVGEANANIAVSMAGMSVLAKRFGVPVEQYVNENLGLTVTISTENTSRGMTEFSEGKTNITLFRGATRDSFMHEMAHVFQNEISKLVQEGVSDPEFVRQATSVLSGTESNPEAFVEKFTQYLSEGKAPSVDLADSFDLFRKWVQQAYRTTDAFGVHLDPEARGFFDALLASESDIEQAKVFYGHLHSIREYLQAQEAEERSKGTNDWPMPEGFEKSKVKETVYHGSTATDISEFFTEPGQTGGNTGAKNTALGAFFSEDPAIAVSASGGFDSLSAFSKIVSGKELTVYSVKLNLRKPLNLDKLSESELKRIEKEFPGFTERYEQHSDDRMPLLRFLASKTDLINEEPVNFSTYAKNNGVTDTSEIDRIFSEEREANPVFAAWKKRQDEIRASVANSVGKKILQAMGYDGIVLTTTADSGEELGPKKQYVVFNPKDAKIVAKQGIADIMENGPTKPPATETPKPEKTALQKQTEARINAYLKALGGKAELRMAVEKRLSETPEYVATDYTRNTGGFRLSELSEFVPKEMAEQLQRLRPELFNKAKNEGKARKYTDPLRAASEAGFDSVEDMVKALIESKPKAEAIKEEYGAELDRIEKSIARGLLHEEGSATPADSAMHSEEYGRAMIAEAALLADKIEKEGKAVARKLEEKAIRAVAERLVQAMSVRVAANVKSLLNSEAAAAKKVASALERGDYQTAYAAQFERTKWFYAAKAAIDLRTWAEKTEARYSPSRILEKLRPKTKGGVENEYAEIVLSLMNEYGFGSKIKLDIQRGPDGKEVSRTERVEIPSGIKAKEPWSKALRGLDESLLEYFPDWALQGKKPDGFKIWKDLSVEQAQDLEAALQSVIKFGEDKLLSLRLQEWEAPSKLVGASIEAMNRLPAGKVPDPNSVGGKLNFWVTKLMRPGMKFENLFERLDDYGTQKTGGIFGPLRSIFSTLIGAEDEYHTYMRQALETLGDAHEVLAEERKRIEQEYSNGKVVKLEQLMAKLVTEVEIPGLPLPEIRATMYGEKAWTVDKLLELVNHTGNSSNRERLKLGYGMTDEQINTLLGLFSEKGLNAIQKIWDATDTLFEHTDKAHFTLTNRHVTRVEAEPFTVVSSDGKTVEMRGGYHPLRYDQKLAGKPFDEKELAKMEADAIHYRITPNRGMTVTRKNGVALPPSLDSSVWYAHVEAAARYASHAVVLRDAARVFSNKEWLQKLDALYGAEKAAGIKTELKKWISDQAHAYLPKTHNSEILNFAMKNQRLGTALIIGYNLKTAAKQRLGVFNAMSVLGQDGKGSWKYLAHAMKVVPVSEQILGLKSGEAYQKLLEISPQARIREDHMNVIIRDLKAFAELNPRALTMFGKKVSAEDIREFGFEFLRMQDRAIVVPIHMAAMEKFMTEHLEIPQEERAQKAIEYADSIIRQSQPASALAEMTPYERMDSMARLWTAFMSFAFTFGGRVSSMAEGWRDGRVTTRQLSRFMCYEVLGVVAGEQLVNYAMGWDWPEEWGQAISDYGFGVWSQMLSFLPVVRDLPYFVQQKKTKYFLGSPAAENVTALAMPIKTTYQVVKGDKEFGLLLNDLGKSAEAHTGIPVIRFFNSAEKTYNNWKDSADSNR